MKFHLIIDPEKDEEIVATVHRESELTEKLQALLAGYTGRLAATYEGQLLLLDISQIECITVIGGKTYAIDEANRQCRLKQRLYELEGQLPSFFIRINKSALANENRLERFAVAYSGAVDAVFRCGYREYVSRRCFSAIKRRFADK